ncbi:MAG: D-tyrosyl-tRNA(Tyr) deacylase [Cyanothece sp. SIO1E1]|nr:D-tyrosyl-tRNA(Tyr) deacylase [Cyanothece sp. SIO1E1]
MKVVVQRVKKASVSVDGEVVGVIQKGLLLLVGVHHDDTEDQLKWMCEKILKLRVFSDEEGKMNKSVSDVGGGILVVSQFTLYGDTKKGTRPSYIEAARPEKAEPMYKKMIEYFNTHSSLLIQGGRFGAMMDVSLVNDGPVTLILEK